jgi:ABC-type enterochelin transport system permease subunit
MHSTTPQTAVNSFVVTKNKEKLYKVKCNEYGGIDERVSREFLLAVNCNMSISRCLVGPRSLGGLLGAYFHLCKASFCQVQLYVTFL